ncbi:MAG: hypothetical protein LBO72_02650 [Helicobacteraceae bacterium]|nr:hypothetical protein [Helicobacteraceae bacterium]
MAKEFEKSDVSVEFVFIDDGSQDRAPQTFGDLCEKRQSRTGAVVERAAAEAARVAQLFAIC